MLLGIQPNSIFSNLTLANSTCPVGLLSIMTQLSKKHNCIIFNEDISGSVIDNNLGLVEKADDILLSGNSGNIFRCIEIARHCKAMGKKVIIGGSEVSLTGPQFIKDNPHFDAMVIGPGEDAIKALINNYPVPNNVIENSNMEATSTIDFNPPFVPLEFNKVKVDYSLLWDLRKYEGLSYIWGADCAQSRKRCFFCGRLRMGIGNRDANTVWSELKWAYDHGIYHYYNTTDSVTTNLSHFIEFCNSKPDDMTKDTHRVFINSRDMNNDLIRALELLNGVAVIGVESFGNIESSGKMATTNNESLYAIKKLCDSEIDIILSFVYGLPNENYNTLNTTEEKILELITQYGSRIKALHLSPLLITTGSPAFSKLMSIPHIRAKYSTKKVPYDVIEMSNDYFENFCNVSRNECIERIFILRDKIKRISPKTSIAAKGILNTEFNYMTKRLLSQVM